MRDRSLKELQSDKKVRNSNLECMRIVCMLLIVAYHYCMHGNGNGILRTESSWNHVWAILFGSWPEIGVYGFVMISSYFLSEQKGIKSKKAVVMVIQAFLFSMMISAIVFGLRLEPFSLAVFLKEALTPYYSQYWFVTTYLIFYLISPILGGGVKYLSNRELRASCVILTALIPVYNMFVPNYHGSLVDFVYIYVVTVYLKNNKDNFFQRNAVKGFLITSAVIILLLITAMLVGTHLNSELIINNMSRLYGTLNPLTAADTFFFFYIFLNRKVFYSKFVNKIAGATLGVYILHENMLFREGSNPLLWDRILHIHVWYTSPFFILHFIVSVIGVFIVCTVIERIRQKVIDEWVIGRLHFLDRLCYKFDHWYTFDDLK